MIIFHGTTLSKQSSKQFVSFQLTFKSNSFYKALKSANSKGFSTQLAMVSKTILLFSFETCELYENEPNYNLNTRRAYKN